MKTCRPHIFPISHWITVGFALIALAPVARAQTATISPAGAGSYLVSVNSSRPLGEVLYALEQKYVVPITFEEAPCQNASELRNFPIKQAGGSIYTFRALPVVDFSVTVDDTLTAPLAVRFVLAAYASSGLPGVYSMVEEGDAIRVFPTEVKGPAGNMLKVKPVMDSPVTFPLATRGAAETLQLIASIVAGESGVAMETMNVPFQYGSTVTMDASGEPAKDLVARIGKIFHATFSFQCMYTATTNEYILNVNSVYVPNPKGGPAIHGFVHPTPTHGSADSSWFQKKE